jgi:hypothetical protein
MLRGSLAQRCRIRCSCSFVLVRRWLSRQRQLRIWGAGADRGAARAGGGQLADPVLDHGEHAFQIEPLIRSRELLQVGLGQIEERERRTGPVLLEVDERARQLDQALIECAIRVAAPEQPQFFQHLMGLEEALAVEALEVTEVMSIVGPSHMPPGERGNPGALAAHNANTVHRPLAAVHP